MHKRGYGQFCPVSRAAEILAERWTPLVVRELLCGSARFNDIQRGVPQMSSSLLSRRLKELEFADIVERRPGPGGRGAEYHLTQAGEELRPIVEGFGFWAQRWVRDDLTAEENLDPALLMWDIRRNVTPEGMPAGRRFVALFDFAGVPSAKRRFWLVFDRGEVDLCMKDPGHAVDLTIASPVKTLVEVWLGHVTIDAARRTGGLKLDGIAKDVRAFRDWFALSLFAREREAASA
ncbi:MAG: helix-turn-helix domain-containing protein [Alphaproteobacteria bacterium]|jgi:DNA-binding HxlR family transcriptional regulator|nr:helix-turn-helix domain-containing protein [Alphaproteobacteria bacterium]